MGAEPLSILLWMRVVNSYAQDYDRIGMLVDILGKEDDRDLSKHFVVEFGPDDAGAFSPEEVERFYAS